MACLKNPLIEYIKYIVALYDADPDAYPGGLAETFTDNSSYEFQSSSNSEYCCPTCGGDYAGGGYYLTFNPAIATPLIIDDLTGCCINYDAVNITSPDFLEFIEAAHGLTMINCCNTFQTCVQNFRNLFQDSYFSVDGVVSDITIIELTLIDDSSVICDLYDYLINNNLSASHLYDIFDTIYTTGGFSVQCEYLAGPTPFKTTVALL